MDSNSTSEEAQGVSDDNPCDQRLKTACGNLNGSGPDVACSRAGERGREEYFLKPGYAWRAGGTAQFSLAETIFSLRAPGLVQSGFFLGICPDPQPVCEDPRRFQLFEKPNVEQFHDSELGDVYDLYNACNGVMRGKLLDVRKLKELSTEELEVLDVQRLNEVWQHTATGCPTCAQIVRTLNEARDALRKGRQNAAPDRAEQ